MRATAPVRVCDLGGWTDTWFAGHGTVVNMAVLPGTEVSGGVTSPGGGVRLSVGNFEEEYTVRGRGPGRHPLLEACLEEIPPPPGTELGITSAVPPGSGMGTSASVAVALLAVLDALTAGGRSPTELAAAAHRVETERLGLQSGIQDQLCAAHGGISFIEMTRYPEATVTRVDVPEGALRDLDGRLVVISLGRAHASSAVHERVIADLEAEGEASPRLDALRRAAVAGRDALVAGDLDALGRTMVENTEAQAALHPSLVSGDAWDVIELAREHGAVGWKVNGAGGDGGSLTVLGGPEGCRDLVRAATEDAWEVLPLRLSPRGVRVTSRPAAPGR